MSTLEPRDEPGYGTVGGGLPQAYPGYPGDFAGQGSWGLPARPNDGGRVPRVIGMIMFFLAAVANALDLLGPDRAWKNPIDEFVTVLLTMACLLTACMLLPAKTRGLGAGLAVGQALAESARYIDEVRPSAFDEFNLVQKLSYTGSYILTALGGVAVVIALLIERGSTERGRRMPSPVLLLGIPGTLFCLVGTLQADYAWVYSGTSQSFACCSWSESDGFEQTSDILLVVAMLATVLFAAFVLKPGLAKGLLGGVVVFLLAEFAVNVIAIVLPTSAAYGYGGGGGGPAVTSQIRSGFWFAAVGLVLVTIAFFVQRGPETSQLGPYGAATAGFAPGTAPGYPPQTGWQQVMPPPLQPPHPQWRQQPPPQPPDPQGPAM